MHFIMGSKAPSQVLRIDVSAEKPEIQEIYLNAGQQISTGSVGATYGNKLLIGSITDRKLLICEMDSRASGSLGILIDHCRKQKLWQRTVADTGM